MTDTMSVPTTRSAAVARVPASAGTRGVDRTPLHDEREGAPTWMRVLGGLLLLAGGSLTAAVLAWPGDAPEAALLVPGLVGVVVGFLLLVARAGFTVTPDHVVLHFRPLPVRRIDRARIVDVRLVEADAATYGGVGLRLRRGSRALILTPGLGVEFTDDRGRATFVRTRRPEAVFRALR